jgi:3-oxoacyl-[acyl-carrier protein] reductase
MHMTRATLKGMIAKRGGNIINVISPSAFRGRPGQTAYAAAKGALLSFTKTLAAEVGGFGIRVNALLPGIIETDMTAGLSEEVRQGLLSRVSMARFGKPEEVASAAALLLRASYMHASVLCVDGGLM